MKKSINDRVAKQPNQFHGLSGSNVGAPTLKKDTTGQQTLDQSAEEGREAEHPLSGPHPTD